MEDVKKGLLEDIAQSRLDQIELTNASEWEQAEYEAGFQAGLQHAITQMEAGL